MNAIDQLPEEVQALLMEEKASRLMRRESFAHSMSKKRDECVTARAASDWEKMVREDAEHYLGIDNANRDTATVIKPANLSGGLMATQSASSNTRSTVFLNITRPYVDAIVARTCDILLPTDGSNWDLQPSPLPELIAKLGDKTPLPQQFQPPMQPQQPGQPPAPPQAPATVADLVQQTIAQARKGAEKAKRRIADWLAETRYNAEVRKVIHDSARIGVGVLKGPAPVHRTSVAYSNGALVATKAIAPESKRVDPLNIFPAPECGEDVHSGSCLWERDFLTAKALRALKGLPGYLTDEIEKCLDEGPTGRTSDTLGSASPLSRNVDAKAVYEVWHGYVNVERDDLESVIGDLDKGDHFHAILTIVNNRIIKAALNPIDTGVFPYDIFPWQRIVGHWAGIGVSRQIRPSQQALNAAHRNCLDNAGLAGGPILIFRRNLVTPADGDWTLRPRKIFYTTEDADLRSVNDAIMAINIPSMQAELMAIMQFELQMCEQLTGFPLLMMGQAGQAAPDTYGGQMLATANASTVLRAIARNFDDGITIPHLGRYYDWLLLYSEDEEEKGDFQIIARGSSALVEMEIQAQEQMQILQMAGNPAFGIDPKKAFAEWLKSRRFDPEKFQYTPEEMEQMRQQQQPPPPAVQAAQIRSQASVQVAQINAEREIAKIKTEYEMELQALQQGHMSPQMAAAQAQIAAAQIRAQAELEKEKYRSDSELAYAQAQSQMAQANDLANMRELELKLRIAEADFAMKHRLSLEQAKAQLATVSMQEQTKRQLAAAKYNFEGQDYERDRQQDYEKHAQNLLTNQQQAQEARVAEREKQDAQHRHEMELKAKELEALKKKVTEAPGKRK